MIRRSRSARLARARAQFVAGTSATRSRSVTSARGCSESKPTRMASPVTRPATRRQEHRPGIPAGWPIGHPATCQTPASPTGGTAPCSRWRWGGVADRPPDPAPFGHGSRWFAGIMPTFAGHSGTDSAFETRGKLGVQGPPWNIADRKRPDSKSCTPGLRYLRLRGADGTGCWYDVATRSQSLPRRFRRLGPCSAGSGRCHVGPRAALLGLFWLRLGRGFVRCDSRQDGGGARMAIGRKPGKRRPQRYRAAK
jgi:hypothetical protein